MSTITHNLPGQVRIGGNAVNLAAGSNLSGTYNTLVTVAGDATITGNLTINGDLIVAGSLYNQGGYAVEIFGDLTVSARINFTPSDTASTQGNVTVHGDMNVHQVDSTPAPTIHSSIVSVNGTSDYVLADDLGALGVPNDDTAVFTFRSGTHNGQSSTFTYSGTEVFLDNFISPNPTNGTLVDIDYNLPSQASRWWINPGRNVTLTVYGNLTIPYLDAGGQDGLTANGLNVIVAGNVAGQLDLYGAFVYDARDAGNGGSCSIGGDCVGFVDTQGGDASAGTGNGGNGGDIHISGDAIQTGYQFAAFGGPAGVNAGNNKTGGKGGNITIGGNFIGSGSQPIINTSGGDGKNGGGAGDAGAITVNGNLSGRAYANGGNYTGDGAPTKTGGHGNLITIGGNIFGTASSIGGNMSNGTLTNSSDVFAGNGGVIVIKGDIKEDSGFGFTGVLVNGGNVSNMATTNNIILHCGDAGDGSGIGGGNGITILGDVFITSNGAISANGGSINGGSAKVRGGSAANIFMDSRCSIASNGAIAAIGGNGGNGSVGGNGGSIFVSGGNIVQVLADGGATDATPHTGNAGNIHILNCSVATLSSLGNFVSSVVTLAGSCNIKTLSTNSYIVGDDTFGGTDSVVTIGSLTDRKTLRNSSSDTQDISSLLNTTIFKYSQTLGQWLFFTTDSVNTVNTTDHITTTIATIATQTDTTMLLKAKVIGRRTGGTGGSTGDTAIYEFETAVKNVGGTVTVQPILTSYNYQDQEPWSVSVSVSGTNVLIQVSGVDHNNISWTCASQTKVF